MQPLSPDSSESRRVLAYKNGTCSSNAFKVRSLQDLLAPSFGGLPEFDDQPGFFRGSGWGGGCWVLGCLGFLAPLLSGERPWGSVLVFSFRVGSRLSETLGHGF